MKTTFLTFISIVLFLLAGNAQSKSDKMYDVFSNHDGVTDFSFSKSMIGGINFDVDNDGDEKQVTGDLNRIRFMSYNPQKGDISGDDFIEKAIGYLPKSVYKKFEDNDGEDDNTEIWLQGKNKNFSECHVFVNNENENGLRIVVSFFGDFKVDDIKGLKKAGKNFSDD